MGDCADRHEKFRSLRGFLEGRELDEPTYFAFSAALRVHGDAVPFEQLERVLGVAPSHAHRKGERRSPLAPEYRDDAWRHRPPVPEAQPLAVHIDALWMVVRPAVDYLRVAEVALQGRRVLRLPLELRHLGL